MVWSRICGERALELPCGEEERPVDERAERPDRRLDDLCPEERRRRDVLGAPLDRDPAFDGDPVGEQRLALPLGVLGAEPLLQHPVLLVEGHPAVGVEQRGHDADDAGGVDDVDDRLLVARRDPHGGVLP